MLRADPYLFFQGRCEEALQFYVGAIGAKVEAFTRFGEMPGTDGPQAAAGKVLHAVLRIGDTVLLASDGQNTGAPSFAGFSLSLSAAADAETERLFAALAEGGQVQVPLGPTPFSSRFGMVADRFGVPWTLVTQA